MAAKRLQDDVDKLLECPVCLDQIKQPKMLRCQHSFCLDPCLRNMVVTVYENGKRRVKCALCRKNYVITSLDNIPDNLQMKNLLEIRQKSVNDGMYFCQLFDYLFTHLFIIILNFPCHALFNFRLRQCWLF